jgi:site-specific DNA-methyltransferase (adenine-specific)
MNIAYNMDCLAAMREMPDKAFDLAVVDPPYRDENENAPFQQMRKASSTRSVFCTGMPTAVFWEQLKRVSKDQIIFGANNYGIPFKGFLVWDKCVRGSDRYSQVEIASLSEGLSTVSSIVKASTYTGEKIHPTQKPVALYAWIFSRYAKPGYKILDTHLGSGSSRIAAYDAGLDFVGYEIDKEYFDKQEERFSAHTAQMNLFID